MTSCVLAASHCNHYLTDYLENSHFGLFTLQRQQYLITSDNNNCRVAQKLDCWQISLKEPNLLHGSVETCVSCGVIFHDDFVAHLLPSFTGKQLENRSAFRKVMGN